jgi:uncharacterized membrane protein
MNLVGSWVFVLLSKGDLEGLLHDMCSRHDMLYSEKRMIVCLAVVLSVTTVLTVLLRGYFPDLRQINESPVKTRVKD